MKSKVLCTSLLLLFAIILSPDLLAQEGKSTLIPSITLAHYSRTGEKSDMQGFYNYPVDPGVELLYQYKLKETLFLCSGFTYQWGRIANYKGAENRFRFSEISFPLIFKKVFDLANRKRSFFISTGISYGKVVNLDWESPYGPDWIDVPREYNEHYSEESYFADILLDAGISFIKDQFSVDPYVKWRVDDNWMGYFRTDLYFGIKFSYHIKL